MNNRKKRSAVLGGLISRARTLPLGIPAGAATSAAAMNVAEVFRRITAALDQAGIPYMLTDANHLRALRAP